MPPAAAPTGGTSDAIASRTTNPNVSDSDGITKTSAAAYARESASPDMRPIKIVSVPAKCSRNSSSAGPAPTIAKRHCGILCRTSLIMSMFFSRPSRPT